MSKRNNFLTSGGSADLDGDGAFSTEKFTAEHESSVMYIAAYDSSGDIVTPSVGTATFEVETMDGQWVSAPSDGDNPVDLTLVGGSASYNIPLYLGSCQRARVTLSGTDYVTDGISYIRAFCWRS